jgi:hypothetical protein
LRTKQAFTKRFRRFLYFLYSDFSYLYIPYVILWIVIILWIIILSVIYYGLLFIFDILWIISVLKYVNLTISELYFLLF